MLGNYVVAAAVYLSSESLCDSTESELVTSCLKYCVSTSSCTVECRSKDSASLTHSLESLSLYSHHPHHHHQQQQPFHSPFHANLGEMAPKMIKHLNSHYQHCPFSPGHPGSKMIRHINPQYDQY